MKKRLCAAVLALAMLCSFWVQPGAAGEVDAANLNQNLLNAILYGERQWVAETLLDDDWSSNPMALLHGVTSGSQARVALDLYEGISEDSPSNAGLYRKLVQLMYGVYNPEDVISGLLDEAGDLVSWVAEQFDSEADLRSNVSDLCVSAEEIAYDSILKAAITDEYKASNGDTVNEPESTLIMLRQTQQALAFLSDMVDFVSTGAGATMDAAGQAELDAEYLDEFATPYADAAAQLLKSTLSLFGFHTGSVADTVAMLATNIGLTALHNKAQPKASVGEFSYAQYMKDEILDDQIKGILNGASTSLKITETAMDSFLCLNSLQQQKETATGPIERAAAIAELYTGQEEYDEMQESLVYFATLLEQEYNNNILDPEMMVVSLRGNEPAMEFLTDVTKWGVEKVATVNKRFLGFTKKANTVSAVTSVSTWLADQALGMKETCENTYVLLHWDKLVKVCVDACMADIRSYKASPSEETAKVVLDDLMLLQRLRLYGEKTAYSLLLAQTDNWYGQLAYALMDNQYAFTAQRMQEEYQAHIDTLVAASVIPPLGGVTVPAGYQLIVTYTEEEGYVGRMLSEDDTKYFVEMGARLAGGVTLDGQLSIGNSAGTLQLGYIHARDGAGLVVKGGTLLVDELYQSDGSMTIDLAEEDSLVIRESLILNNCTYTSASDTPLKTKNLILTGTMTGGAVEATGTVTGAGAAEAAALPALGLTGTQNQTIKGTLTAGDLYMSAPQVTVEDSVTVTGTLSAPVTKVRQGQNICFSGTAIKGGTFNGSLTAKDAAVANVTINGTLYDQGGTTYAGTVQTAGGLSIFGPSSTAAGSYVTVSGPAWLSNQGTLAGTGTLILRSDLAAEEEGKTLEQTVWMQSAAPQVLSGSWTIDSIHFDNSSSAGIEVTDTLQVLSLLDHASGVLRTTFPVFLGEHAKLGGNRYNGDVTVLNWNLTDPITLGGNLTVEPDGTLYGGSLDLSGQLVVRGNMVLRSCDAVVGSLSTCYTLTITDDASLTVRGAALCAGTVHNASPLIVGGDLQLAGASVNGPVKVRGDVLLTDASTVDTLTLDGILPQQLTGSALTVKDLNLWNPAGVHLNSAITVTGRYDSSGCPVTGGRVTGGLSADQTITEDTIIHGDLTLNEALTVAGAGLTIEGDLLLSSGSLALDCGSLTVRGSVKISDGDLSLTASALTVGGSLWLPSGHTLTLDDTSTLNTAGWLYSNGTTLNLAGTLNVGSDLVLNGSAVTGGHVRLGGDLSGTGAIALNSLTCSGKLPQTLSAALTVGDLTLDNPSGDGVTLTKPITYTGTLTRGTTAVTGETNLVKGES